MPFDPLAVWGAEWERRRIRNRIHLTFTGCLGPCAVGNNALLVMHGRSIWLKDLNRPELAIAVYDWIETMLAALKFSRRRMNSRTTSTTVSFRRHSTATSRWWPQSKARQTVSIAWTLSV